MSGVEYSGVMMSGPLAGQSVTASQATISLVEPQPLRDGEVRDASSSVPVRESVFRWHRFVLTSTEAEGTPPPSADVSVWASQVMSHAEVRAKLLFILDGALRARRKQAVSA